MVSLSSATQKFVWKPLWRIETPLLLLMLWLVGKRLAKALPAPGALNGDAYWAYLPSAHKILHHPWTFLTTDPASYHVAPLGYIWPAIWGANQISIQFANCALFLTSIVLLCGFVREVGGLIAAFVAGVILLEHPDIHDHAAQVLTEAPYFFGFSLALFSIGKAATNAESRQWWLGAMSIGLTITLLTRPVLQYMLLLALATSFAASLLSKATRSGARAVTIALTISLALPAAFIIKNGVAFGVWSIASGSGSGLFYGVSPYRNGAEPVYSNFSYDADVIPRLVDSSAAESALSKRSNELNQAAALEIVKQTQWIDNMVFFGAKMRMWLLTSTPELYINPKLRWIRLFEWFSIIACVLLAAYRVRQSPLELPGRGLSNHHRGLLFTGLLSGVFLMAMQLSPVLYNTRYASYFIEPWLIAASGISVGYVFSGNLFPWRHPARVLAGLGLIIFLVYMAHALTQHAVRREVWEIDSRRPGPTAVIVPTSGLARVHGTGMEPAPDKAWLFTSSPATLHISIDATVVPSHDHLRDALWRMRFALQTPDAKPMAPCGKAILTVTPHQENMNWHRPQPLLFVRTDGKPRDYMLSANGESRPRGNAQVSLTFNCPAGSRLTWHGMELRSSTLTESARDFLLKGSSIDPYLHEPIPVLP